MDAIAGYVVIISRAANGDEEGWMQILVFIVLAVVWAVGGIIKARGAKTQQDKQKEQPKPRPQPRPRPSLERFLQTEPQKARTKPVQTRSSKMARQPLGFARGRLEQDKAAEQARKKPKQTVQPFYKSIMPEEMEIKSIEQKQADKTTALATVPMYGDSEVEIGTTEQLRAAMLHFEIFGKCVGLRETQEHVWMR